MVHFYTAIYRKISLQNFNSLNLQSGPVVDELKALIAHGWTVPKLAHELGKSSRQVYRWLEGAKCNGEIRWAIRILLKK
ncbi:helix-turn-helix domain-containing protein [Nitrosomonas sp. PY1]|uniref:helix-turn-helix domain-containing protein n=1 Tax=Nitrosomonas sp. PY1 TaxID=1803906 RepID=UPI0035D4D9AE